MVIKRFFTLPWVRTVLWHSGIVGVLAAIVALLSWLFDIACPIYAILGICCPFCGMTRAHLAALRLDFATALNYHPIFFVGVPFLWVIFHESLFKKPRQKVLWYVLVSLFVALLLGVYLFRVISTGSLDFFA